MNNLNRTQAATPRGTIVSDAKSPSIVGGHGIASALSGAISGGLRQRLTGGSALQAN